MEYEKDYDLIFEHLKAFEGHYVNDPDDLGEETYMGITRKNHPDFKIWEKLDTLTYRDKRAYRATESELEDIKNLYYIRYWMGYRCNSINNPGLRCMLFDFVVGSGKYGVMELQKVLGVKVDGKIGNMTIGMANTKCSQSPHSQDILLQYKNNRDAFYHRISLYRNNRKFLRGWLRRSQACYDLASTMDC